MGRMPPRPRGPKSASSPERKSKAPVERTTQGKGGGDESKSKSAGPEESPSSVDVETEGLGTINLGDLQDTIAGSGRRTSPRKKVQSKSSDEDDDDPAPPPLKPRPGPASKTRSPAKTKSKDVSIEKSKSETSNKPKSKVISVDKSISVPSKPKSKGISDDKSISEPSKPKSKDISVKKSKSEPSKPKSEDISVEKSISEPSKPKSEDTLVDKSITAPSKPKSSKFKPRVILPTQLRKRKRTIEKKSGQNSNENNTKESTLKSSKGSKSGVKSTETDLIEAGEGEDMEGSGNEGEEEVEEILVSEKIKMEEDGRNIFALMSQEDTEEFLSRLQRQCSPLDRAMYQFREKSIKWNLVAFGAYGEYQCKCVWTFFRSHTRKHRIMYELVNELKFKLADSVSFQFKLIESMPGFPQKPPSAAFHVYNRERWNAVKDSVQDSKDLPNFVKFQQQCKEEYNCLTEPEKRKYEDRVALLQAEYEKQVKAFYAENPGVAKLVEKLHKQETLRKERLKKQRAEVRQEKRKTDRADRAVQKKLNPVAAKERKKVLKMPNPFPDAPQPPATPVVLFIQAKLNRIEPPPLAEDIPHCKTRFLNKWKRLGGPKKVKWIDYCISLCEEFLLELERYKDEHPGFSITKSLKVKQLLTREEISLWETEHGKPAPPKGTVYDLFIEELLQSDAALSEMSDNERDAIARNKWSELDWYHKEMYRMKYKISIVEYKKQIQEFIAGLPEFMKEWCMERIPKKFHKVCNEVDTVPPDELGASTFPLDSTAETNEQPPPRKKKKKESKPNANTLNPLPEAEITEIHKDKSGLLTNTVEDPLPEASQQQHIFEQPRTSPKKRKRKERDPELITGDIFSDSQSESHTDGESEQRRARGGIKNALLNSSTPIYQQEVTPDMQNELRLLKGKADLDEKLSDAVRKQVELMEEADNKTVHHITEAFVKKLKRSKYPVTKEVSQRDIFNAIRGFFDGRAHLGYDYSVYYYYAKHVALEPYWINCINSKGLQKAALKAIKTFLALNDHQKEVFVEDSARWHMSKATKQTKRVYCHKGLYPGEPTPPARLLTTFYKQQVISLRKKFPDIQYPSFTNLDPTTQNYYVKKYYHETKLYMRRFDMFMKSMTPNDLVSYAVFKARNWETNLYFKHTLKRAMNEYIFPFCKNESKLEGYGKMCLPIAEPPKVGYNAKKSKQCNRKKLSNNPFSNDAEFMNIAKKFPVRKKRRQKKSTNAYVDKIAECRRIIKIYADKNIIIQKLKTKKKTRLHENFSHLKYKRERRLLAHLLWAVRILKKKAEIAGVEVDINSAASPEENQTGASKSQSENKELKRSNRGRKGNIFKLSVQSVDKRRRVVENVQQQQHHKPPPIIHTIEAMESRKDWDEISDTEINFSLYPRAQPRFRFDDKTGKIIPRKYATDQFRFKINKSLDNWKKRRELIIHRAQKYHYPLQDLLENEGIREKPQIKYTYHSSTQTEYRDNSNEVSTQTNAKVEKKKVLKSRGTVTLIKGAQASRHVCKLCKDRRILNEKKKRLKEKERVNRIHLSITDEQRRREMIYGFTQLTNLTRQKKVVGSMLDAAQAVYPNDLKKTQRDRSKLKNSLLAHVKFVRACQVALHRNPKLDLLNEDTVVDAILDAHKLNLARTFPAVKKKTQDKPNEIETTLPPAGADFVVPISEFGNRSVEMIVPNTSGPTSAVNMSELDPAPLTLSPLIIFRNNSTPLPASAIGCSSAASVLTAVPPTFAPLAIFPNSSIQVPPHTVSSSPAPMTATVSALHSDTETEPGLQQEFVSIISASEEDPMASSSE